MVNVRKVTDPYLRSTKSIEKEAIAVGNLRHYATVFYTDNYAKELEGDTLEVLQSVLEDESFPKSSSREINPYLFKTPLDIVLTRAEPERKFLEMLCRKENAEKISGWVKSRDRGFYGIEYSITTTGGKHSKRQSFNPDFFIRIEEGDWEYFVVVEIKSDNDDSQENRAKLRYAKQHFDDLNDALNDKKIKQKYLFHFLSPSTYVAFFAYLQNGNLTKNEFRSDLEDKLYSNEDD